MTADPEELRLVCDAAYAAGLAEGERREWFRVFREISDRHTAALEKLLADLCAESAGAERVDPVRPAGGVGVDPSGAAIRFAMQAERVAGRAPDGVFRAHVHWRGVAVLAAQLALDSVASRESAE